VGTEAMVQRFCPGAQRAHTAMILPDVVRSRLETGGKAGHVAVRRKRDRREFAARPARTVGGWCPQSLVRGAHSGVRVSRPGFFARHRVDDVLAIIETSVYGSVPRERQRVDRLRRDLAGELQPERAATVF